MNRVAVCVTRQVSCKRLIETGARFVAQSGGELLVVHVAQPDSYVLGNAEEGVAMEFLMNIARKHDAEMTVLRSANVMPTLIRYVRDKKVTHIILGVANASSEPSTVGKDLERQLENVQVIVVPA